MPTDHVSGCLIVEGKNYSHRVAIIGFPFWLSSNILNKHINGGIYGANWIIKSAEERAYYLAHFSLKASVIDDRDVVDESLDNAILEL